MSQKKKKKKKKKKLSQNEKKKKKCVKEVHIRKVKHKLLEKEQVLSPFG